MGAPILPLDAWHLSIGRRQDASGAARSFAPDRYTLVIQSRIWRARARAFGSSVALVQASMAIWKLSRFGWTSSSPDEYMSCMFIRIYGGMGATHNDETLRVRDRRRAQSDMTADDDHDGPRTNARQTPSDFPSERNSPAPP